MKAHIRQHIDAKMPKNRKSYTKHNTDVTHNDIIHISNIMIFLYIKVRIY